MATVTIQEAARRLGVKPGKVRALISARKLAARPISPLADMRGRDDMVLDADEVETLARLRAHKRRARTAGREQEGPHTLTAEAADTPVPPAALASTVPVDATASVPVDATASVPVDATASVPVDATPPVPDLQDDVAAAPANPAPAAGVAFGGDGASLPTVAASTATAVDPVDGSRQGAGAGAPGGDTHGDRAVPAAVAGTPSAARRDQPAAEDDEARRALSGDVESSTALDLAGQRMVALVQSMLTPLVGELHDARETIRRQAEELGALRAAVADLERRVAPEAPGAAPQLVEPAPASTAGSAAQPARESATGRPQQNGAAPFGGMERPRRQLPLWRRALSHLIGD